MVRAAHVVDSVGLSFDSGSHRLRPVPSGSSVATHEMECTALKLEPWLGR